MRARKMVLLCSSDWTLYCITKTIGWCDHGFAYMSAGEGMRWVFEVEKTYQIGFSCMVVGDLTGLHCSLSSYCSMCREKTKLRGKSVSCGKSERGRRCSVKIREL